MIRGAPQPVGDPSMLPSAAARFIAWRFAVPFALPFALNEHPGAAGPPTRQALTDRTVPSTLPK